MNPELIDTYDKHFYLSNRSIWYQSVRDYSSNGLDDLHDTIEWWRWFLIGGSGVFGI